MDSLTQIALGATVGAICVSPKDKRRAAVVGAVLGTLPDLDVLIRYADPIDNFIKHRGFSHSFLVLVTLSLLIWFIARKLTNCVSSDPYTWLASITLALVTHPILDAHTVYGTQLLWPLDTPPVMWSTIFIIDPAYTLPLVLSTVFVIWAPRWKHIQTTLVIGLLISSGYLAWSWVGKIVVNHKLASALNLNTTEAQKYFTVPTPFNTLLWRVVVMNAEGYQEGFYSLRKPNQEIIFRQVDVDPEAQDLVSTYVSYKKLQWFSHGFIKTEIIEDHVIISDLRMGSEPDYVFRFAIGAKASGAWLPITPLKKGTRYDRERLKEIFEML